MNITIGASYPTHLGALDADRVYLLPAGYEWCQEDLARLGHDDCRVAWDRKMGCFCIVRKSREAHTIRLSADEFLTHLATIWCNVANFLDRKGFAVEPNVRDWHMAYCKDPQQFQVDNSAWVNRSLRRRERFAEEQRAKESRTWFAEALPDALSPMDSDLTRVKTAVTV